MRQKIVNEKLVAARLERHWTQEQTCERLGVPNVRTYQRWETEGVIPSPYFRKRLCEVFGMSLTELGIFPRVGRATALQKSTPAEQEGCNDREKLFTSGGVLAEHLSKEVLVLTGQEAELFLSRLGAEDMAQFDPQRRSALLTALQAIGTASEIAVVIPPILANSEPWERLTAAADHPSALNSETLSTFESLTQACWKLSNSGELSIAETTLSGFLPQLKQVAPHQPAVASLASQGLQLRSILTHHRLKLADKLAICQEAVAFAKQSHDDSTLVAALNELAVAYYHTGRYEEALKVCQENLSYCDQATPLVQARAYGQAALEFALHNRKREASFYLGLAQEILPDRPEQDASFWFANSGYHMLVLYELLIHLQFGEARAAWDTLEQYKKHVPTLLIPERWRLEIVNAQGRAALLGNDLEKYASCLEEGIAGAIALKSKKRLAEAYSIFQQDMPTGWLQHQKIKPIVERYQLQPKG
jgi:transcriptional regulator with XRE-family HTH domain